MRFSLFSVLSLGLAGTALGAATRTWTFPISSITSQIWALTHPPGVEQRSLITDIGEAVAKLEEGLGVDELEELLNDLLGDSLHKVSLSPPLSSLTISNPPT